MPEYIEREALRAEALRLTKQTEFPFDNCFPYWQFSKCIKEAPAVDAVPVVHAHWTHSESNDRAYDYCSACRCGTMRRTYGYNPDGREYVTEQSYSYCPRCGARMDGKEP